MSNQPLKEKLKKFGEDDHDESLVTANCSTHLKIVVVALLAAMIVIAVGINGHIGSSSNAISHLKTGNAVVKF